MSLKNFNARPGRKLDQKTLDLVQDKNQKHRFTIRFPAKLYEKIRKAAWDQNIEISTLVCEILWKEFKQ